MAGRAPLPVSPRPRDRPGDEVLFDYSNMLRSVSLELEAAESALTVGALGGAGDDASTADSTALMQPTKPRGRRPAAAEAAAVQRQLHRLRSERAAVAELRCAALEADLKLKRRRSGTERRSKRRRFRRCLGNRSHVRSVLAFSPFRNAR